MDAKNFEKYLNSKFWFKNLKRILWNGEPIRLKSKEYKEKYPDITLRSLSSFSSKDFDSLKDENKKVDSLGMPVKSVQKYITSDYENAFWALNGGTGIYRLLGQEFARDLSIQNYIDASKTQRERILKRDDGQMLEKARLVRKKSSGAPISDLDPDKALLDGVQGMASVKDLLKMLSAERMAEDPALLLSLVPEDQIDKTKLSKLASPMLVADGKNYYDPALVLDEKAGAIPTLFDGTKEYVLGKDLKLVTVEVGEFDEFMTNLQKNLKVKLVANSDLDAGTVVVNNRSMLRNAGRAALDKLKYRLNYRKNAINRSYEVEYSTKGTKDEQIYSVLKHMGTLICSRSFEDFERQYGVSNIVGLPKSDDYQKLSHLIKDAAASLAAFQLAAGFLPRRTDNDILTEFFKVDAMKALAKIPEDNTWVAGVLGAVLSNSLNNAFANGKVYDGIYESNTYSRWGKAKTFLSTMFSKKRPREFSGVLTQMSGITKAQLDAKFGPQNKFDINSLTNDQENIIKMLVGQHVQELFEKTTQSDSIKNQNLDEQCAKVYAEIMNVGGMGTPEGLKIYSDNENLFKEKDMYGLKTAMYYYSSISNEKYLEKYPTIFYDLQQKEFEEVVSYIKSNPDLCKEELNIAVAKSLEYFKINANTQNRIDTATFWLGGYGMHAVNANYIDRVDKIYEQTKSLAIQIEDNRSYVVDNKFREKLEEYQSRKNISDDVRKEIEQKLMDLEVVQNEYAYFEVGEKLSAKEYGQILDDVKEEFTLKTGALLGRVEEVFDDKEYGNAVDAAILQKEIITKNIKIPAQYCDAMMERAIDRQNKVIETFDQLKEFVENIPEARLSLESKETKDELKALILKDILNAVKLEKGKIQKIVKENEKDEETVYINRLGEITIQKYDGIEKNINKDQIISEDVNKFAENILLVMKGESVQSTEQLYSLYVEKAEKESLPSSKNIFEKIDKRIEIEAAYEFAVEFEDVVLRAEKINGQNTKILNQNYKKLQEIEQLRDELLAKGLSKDDEAFKSFNDELLQLMKNEISERKLHEEQKDIVSKWDESITAIKIAKPNMENQQEQDKFLKNIDVITTKHDIEKLELIDFTKIDELAQKAQASLIAAQRSKQFERKQRDWAKVAQIVKNAQKKGLDLEGTIKAIEEYKSPKEKEQTAEDKENIKEFFGVLSYAIKLGDKVFEKESERVLGLSEEERAKLSDGSVKEFENLKEWLHIEKNFNGINNLSDQLHEYKTRAGTNSRSATEIYGIYFDLASKIIEVAASDAKNSQNKSATEISRDNIKLKDVNGIKEDLTGLKVMEKKLEKFMPKLDQEKIRAYKERREKERREKQKQKREELKKQNEVSYEELILNEILKTFADYSYVDSNTENTIKLLSYLLKQEIIPAKVGEKVDASKLSTKELDKIEKAKEILVEAIKEDATECREIEEKIKSKGKLPDDLQKLKESVMGLAKKTEFTNTLANFISIGNNTSKDVKQIVEEVQKESLITKRAQALKVKKMIVNHSNMDKMFRLSIGILDELCQVNLRRTEREKEADNLIIEMQNRNVVGSGKARRSNRQQEIRQKTRNFFRSIQEQERIQDGNNSAKNDEILL